MSIPSTSVVYNDLSWSPFQGH